MTMQVPKPSIAASGHHKIIHIVQGEHYVSDDPDVVLATLLGSCVAACIRDVRSGIGGMNHFLLPGSTEVQRPDDAERYAAHLMELLVNALLNAGASRRHMEAKLFGGASTLSGRTDIGAKNAEFATHFLAREDIPLIGQCMGGPNGRRVQYWPTTGRARRSFISNVEVPLPALVPSTTSINNAGSLELF